MEEITTFHSENSKINSDLLTCSDSEIVETLLFGNILFNQFDNNRIVDDTIISIDPLKRFDVTPFHSA